MSSMSPAVHGYSTDVTHSVINGPRHVMDGHSLESSRPVHDDFYCNLRLDPANFIQGPLSSNPATRFRQMLARPGIIVALVSVTGSVHDAHWEPVSIVYTKDQYIYYQPFVFKSFYLTIALIIHASVAATTASRLGQLDLAIATLNDFVEAGQMVSLNPSTPVIADADTGFGGAAMAARTVQQYTKAGVTALHIEDQVQTERCGHLLGKGYERKNYSSQLLLLLPRGPLATSQPLLSDLTR